MKTASVQNILVRRRALAGSVASVAAILLAAPATYAASFTWSGGSAVNGSSSATTNWSGGTVPAAGSDLIFTASPRNIITWNGIAGPSINIATITLNGAATLQIVNGTQTAIQFVPGTGTAGGNFNVILNNTTLLQTIAPNAAVFYQGIKTINAGSGGLQLDGGITLRSDSMTSGQTITLNLSGTATTSTVSSIAQAGTGFAAGVLNAVTKNGTGTWTLTGAGSYVGPTTITQGTLQIGNGTTGGSLSTSSVITNNANLAFNRSNTITQGTNFANSISGTGKVIQNGGGTLVLSGTNSYQGGTTLNSGTVAFGNGSLGTAGAVTFAGNSSLQWASGNTQDLSSRLVMSSAIVSTLDTNSNDVGFASAIGSSTTGALTKTGAGTLTLAGANSYTGATTISQGTLQVGNGTTGGALSTSSAITNNANLAFNRSDTITQGTDFANSISGSGKVIQNGGGVLALSGTNSYQGGTTLNSGIVAFGSGSLGTLGAVTFAGSSSLQWSTGNTQDLSSRLVMGNGVTSTLDTNSNDVGFASAIGSSTSGALTKAGAGTLTLSGANSYTGATTVSAGKLLVSGSISSSSMTNVNSGGMLGGTGSVGAITLNPGGAVEAGSISNDLAATSLTWNGAADTAFAQVKFELSTVDNTASDKLTLSGLLIKGTGSVFQFDFLNGGMGGGNYTLLTFLGGQTGFAVSNFSYSGLAPNLNGTFNLQTNALVFNVVPEPGSIVSLMSGMGMLLGLRRFRRRIFAL